MSRTIEDKARPNEVSYCTGEIPYKTKTFKDLTIGDEYIAFPDNSIFGGNESEIARVYYKFIRTEKLKKGEVTYNAVKVHTGELFSFPDDMPVVKII